jgi:hypothetical protein
VALVATPTLAQEAGWHYSPFPHEGDRATLGCAKGATPESYACLAVRCEDDFTTGVHIHTSRPEGDAGAWTLEFDGGAAAITATAAPDASPYHARFTGDVEPILFGLKNAGLLFLTPPNGEPLEQGISLTGSLTAINQALYFCAPKTSGDEVPAVDGQNRPGDVPGEGTAQK